MSFRFRVPDDNKVPPELRADFISEEEILSAGGGRPSIEGPPIEGLAVEDSQLPPPPMVEAAPSTQGPSREELLRRVLAEQQAHDSKRSGRLSEAAQKDRQAQAQSDTREYLRAAFTRKPPQLRNVGQSFTQEAMAEGNSGPLSRELQLQKVLAGYQQKPEDPEMRAARLKMLLSQGAMYDRANQPKEPAPPKNVDADMRDADLALKKARAAYLAKGGGRSGGSKAPVLAPGTVETLANFEPANAGIDHALEKFRSYGVSGTAGAVGGAMPKFIKTDANKYFDEIRADVQMVGTILEGGKLAAGDEGKYQNMFPKPGDTPEIAQVKAQNLRNLLRIKEQALRKGLKGQGYKVDVTEAPANVQTDNEGKKWRELPDGSFEEVL